MALIVKGRDFMWPVVLRENTITVEDKEDYMVSIKKYRVRRRLRTWRTKFQSSARSTARKRSKTSRNWQNRKSSRCC